MVKYNLSSMKHEEQHHENPDDPISPSMVRERHTPSNEAQALRQGSQDLTVVSVVE